VARLLYPLSDQNPLAGIIPRTTHEVRDGETTVYQYVEKIEGEVALDAYVRAQTSAPQVVKADHGIGKRIQRLANANVVCRKVIGDTFRGCLLFAISTD
jgi:hypothetical protein